MNKSEIIRAWKDAEYRAGLSEEQQSALPNNPVGMVALDDADLEQSSGGAPYTYITPVCNSFNTGCPQTQQILCTRINCITVSPGC